MRKPSKSFGNSITWAAFGYPMKMANNLPKRKDRLKVTVKDSDKMKIGKSLIRRLTLTASFRVTGKVWLCLWRVITRWPGFLDDISRLSKIAVEKALRNKG